MPIYEYECVPKKHRFEELQKIDDRPLSKCKVCGGKVNKVISSTSFQLKGGGWYKDGYSSNGSSPKKTTTSTKTETKKPSKEDV